jgi:hypothetical protein
MVRVGNELSKEFESVTIDLVDQTYVENEDLSDERKKAIKDSLISNGFNTYSVAVKKDDKKKVVDKKAEAEAKRIAKAEAKAKDKQDDMVDITKIIFCHPDHSEDDPINCEYEIKYDKIDTDSGEPVETIEKIQIVDGYYTSENDTNKIEALKSAGFVIMGEAV